MLTGSLHLTDSNPIMIEDFRSNTFLAIDSLKWETTYLVNDLQALQSCFESSNCRCELPLIRNLWSPCTVSMCDSSPLNDISPSLQVNTHPIVPKGIA